MARIDRLTPSNARRLIMRRWWVNIPVTPSRSSEEADQAWHWDKFVIEANTDSHRSYMALTGRDGRLGAEGAIIFRLDARSHLEPGWGAAYLQYLAAAPRNRSRLVGTQAIYKGIGEALVTIAILESLSFGLEGRIFGEPLPDAVSFYEKMGFEPIPMDARPGRVYYEIPGLSPQSPHQVDSSCVDGRTWLLHATCFTLDSCVAKVAAETVNSDTP